MFNILLLAASLMFAAQSVSAQTGEYSAYTPYSIFGVGSLSNPGSAYNRSMGGVGIASRNHRYLNTVNPAAITARDSLAFMLDFTIENSNTIFQQSYNGSDYKSANNATNISSFAISFPIWRSVAMSVGLRPYSAVGYTFTSQETDPHIIANNGNISYENSGLGSLYNIFASAGVGLFNKRLSLGAEFDYIFGNIEKDFVQEIVNSGYNEVQNVYEMSLHGMTGKFGIQYEQPIGGKWKLGVGATYLMSTKLKGYVDYSNLAVGSAESITVSSYSDTLSSDSKVKLAAELGVGISINYADKFRAELDYTRADWTNSGMDLVDGFSTSGAAMTTVCSTRDTYRLGFEYVPNINDVRYYRKKIAYRAGAYYSNEYFKVNGNPINSVGFTLGATLPVFRWYNGLTVTMDLGQRGSMENSLVRERYIKFSVGVNLFDIWFQKPRYE